MVNPDIDTARRPLTQDRVWPVWLVSALATVVAASAAEVYGLLARAFGVTMSAGDFGSSHASPITTGTFAVATLIPAFFGMVLAVLLARYTRRPDVIYLRTTLVLTAISLANPLAAGDTAISTKLMLCGGHVVAALIVIPAVTHRLAKGPIGRVWE